MTATSRASWGLCATSAARSKNSYLSARYRRIAARRGKKRALVAVGHSILTSVWHMIQNDTEYQDLGPDFCLERLGTTGKARKTRRLISELNQLGYQVALTTPEAA